MNRAELQELIKRKGFIPSEEVDQRNLARYLDMLGLRWAHIPNGGHRNKIVAAKLKGQGVKPGVPDNFIFDAPPLYPCAPGAVIELKRVKGGTTSPEQKDWLNYLAGRGWIVKVCKGFDEAVEFIKSLGYGGNNGLRAD